MRPAISLKSKATSVFWHFNIEILYIPVSGDTDTYNVLLMLKNIFE